MKTNIETKQNPVVKLSEFCYNLVIKRFVLADLPLAFFQVHRTNSTILEKLTRSVLLSLPCYALLLAEKSRLGVTYLYKRVSLAVSFYLPFVFNERFTRSESIILNLTTKVKNVVLKSCQVVARNKDKMSHTLLWIAKSPREKITPQINYPLYLAQNCVRLRNFTKLLFNY